MAAEVLEDALRYAPVVSELSEDDVGGLALDFDRFTLCIQQEYAEAQHTLLGMTAEDEAHVEGVSVFSNEQQLPMVDIAHHMITFRSPDDVSIILTEVDDVHFLRGFIPRRSTRKGVEVDTGLVRVTRRFREVGRVGAPEEGRRRKGGARGSTRHEILLDMTGQSTRLFRKSQ